MIGEIKCVWRFVAENDLEKISKSDDKLTFADSKTKCYHCKGYDLDCKEYTPKKYHFSPQ